VTSAVPGEAAFARPARQSDVERLAAMYAHASDELSPVRGGRVLLGLKHRGAPVERTFAIQLEDPRQFVVVAVLGPDDVVGYGTCRTLELPEKERLGSIEDLYVTPAARRYGAGRAMTALLVRWCSSEGCIGVDASALPGSRAVKSFFEGEGFTARLLVMHRPLR
jgi:ribosomal protein S18 acetylase RimI-like enzyme